jgi:hypothetical protein
MHVKPYYVEGTFYFTSKYLNSNKSHHGRDRMAVGLITTYAISAYHHGCCEFEFGSGRGAQYYVIEFVSNLGQVSGFLWVFLFPPLIKLTNLI